MRVIYFTDDCHVDRFITEDGRHGYIEDLIALLCTPHSEEFKIRKVFMDILEDDPAVPDKVFLTADRGWKGIQLDEYEFNSVWTFTEEF